MNFHTHTLHHMLISYFKYLKRMPMWERPGGFVNEERNRRRSGSTPNFEDENCWRVNLSDSREEIDEVESPLFIFESQFLLLLRCEVWRVVFLEEENVGIPRNRELQIEKKKENGKWRRVLPANQPHNTGKKVTHRAQMTWIEIIPLDNQKSGTMLKSVTSRW